MTFLFLKSHVRNSNFTRGAVQMEWEDEWASSQPLVQCIATLAAHSRNRSLYDAAVITVPATHANTQPTHST